MNEKYKSNIISIISDQLPNCTIFVFGSRAQHSNRSGSDIDIALDNEKKIESTIIRKIKDNLEDSTIPYFVDIIDLNNISEDFKSKIQSSLKLWKK